MMFTGAVINYDEAGGDACTTAGKMPALQGIIRTQPGGEDDGAHFTD